MSGMNTVLYFQPQTKTSAPKKLEGVREILERRSYNVQVIEERPTKRMVAELVDFWSPVGAIVDCGAQYNDIDAKTFGSLNTVFLGHNPDTLPSRCLLVSNDQAETASAAARELLATGYANFAFVHVQERRMWSELRERGFTQALAINGHTAAVFGPTGSRLGEIGRMKALRRFLASQPKPCAVFAANDRTAEKVLAAARLESLSVPGDVAIVGVDNYEPICEHASTQLTSVELDFRRGGNLAALMLLGCVMSKGRWRGSRTQTFGPLRVVRRASSRVLLAPDRHVSAALGMIRERACAGLTSAQVAATFPCSRRMADMRFRRATGHTILDEIHAVQLQRAQELAANPNLPLKAISDFCGFTNPNSLRKFFRRATGRTLSSYRAASRRA